MYQLDPQLERDTITIGQAQLCEVLLMNDARYPWVILVPRRLDISECYQLTETDQNQLMRESAIVAKTLAEMFNADKMNVAALGNVVNQLHIHHIVRFHHDPVWPAPVWGKGVARPYQPLELKKILAQLQQGLSALMTHGN